MMQFSTWNWRRIIYFLGGLFFVALAWKDQVWWIAIIGVYYILMAIFKWGCVGKNCQINQNNLPKND